MWLKVLLAILAIWLLVIFQVTFLGSLGFYFGNFNLILALLVLLLFLLDFRGALFFALAVGLLLDLYSSLPFGIFLLSLFAVAVAAEFLLFNFLTNRSIYSLLSLGLAAVVVFQAIFLISSGLAYLAGLTDFYVSGGYWRGLVYQTVSVLLLLVILFWPINSRSRKFKPNFI